MTVEPFEIVWDEARVGQVLDRVRTYPFEEARTLPHDGWRHGFDADTLRRLCTHWTETYDWRGAVRELNRWPQIRVQVEGVLLHAVHVVGEAAGRRPLLLTHGWPSSVHEFWEVIEPLAFPTRHGGRAEDAFDLVIPSLPGFGWSELPGRMVDQLETARLFDRLMTDVLGYGTYLAQGGDWGALVTAMLGLEHADHVRAILMTMLLPRPAAMPPGEDAAVARWQAAAQENQERLGAYAALQGTRPASLAWAMAGNPVGQAAWILERFHDWADLRERPFEAVFTPDRLITAAMVYVMQDALPTSVRYYAAAREAGMRALPAGRRVEVPTAFTFYPDPRHPMPPRAVAQMGYAVSRWVEMARGGHFPAVEVPQDWVEDVRAWARSV